MSGNVEWQPKTPSEVVVRYADFTDELASGEFLNSASFVATVWSGNDPAPAILVSVTVINNSFGVASVAQVVIQNGVLGTIYQCVVIAPTNLGRNLTKTAALAIKPPLN